MSTQLFKAKKLILYLQKLTDEQLKGLCHKYGGDEKMPRDSYGQGADDAQHYGEPNRRLYIDPYSSYAEGFDNYMKEHPLCSKCEEDAQPGTSPPMCIGCLQEASACPANAGSGFTPETKEEG